MNKKVNDIYNIAENTLNSDDIDRLIDELETLKERKEREELAIHPEQNPFLASYLV